MTLGGFRSQNETWTPRRIPKIIKSTSRCSVPESLGGFRAQNETWTPLHIPKIKTGKNEKNK